MPVSSSVSPVVDELSTQFGKQSLSSSASSSSSSDETGACAKTSQNITESVPVPSSEHVAEIVGRQGCKIKALRAKTNTYIKTPIRGETPMFVITGRREDVLTAKREIQLAADHFSQIRARRGSGSTTTTTGQLSPVEGGCGGSTTLVAKPTTSPKLIPQQVVQSGSSSLSSSASISPTNRPAPTESILTAKPVVFMPRSNSTSPNTVDNHHQQPNQHHHQYVNPHQHHHHQQPSSSQGKMMIPQVASAASVQLQPGQVCKKVTVPYQVVGLVVGPKGSTIKRIQQNTNTYIVTPSRDSQPVFEIQGMAENVEAAKQEIENYIMLRTTNQHGGGNASSSSSSSSCSNVEFGSLNGLMVGTVDTDDFKPNHHHVNPHQVHPCHYQLMSPQSTSLFQSVVNVVDDFIPKNNTSIWSTNTNKLCDDLFLNSIAQQPQQQQQQVNNSNPNGQNRSSSSSCSSSTSSSFSSSSFCGGSNEATLGTSSLLAQSSFSSMLLNDSSTSGSAFDFALQPQLQLSTSSSSSSPAVVNHDLLLNSLFSQQSQPHDQPQQSLLFTGLNHTDAAENYNNFYYFNAANNANISLDAQNFI